MKKNDIGEYVYQMSYKDAQSQYKLTDFEVNVLKKKSIHDIKDYLRNHNLIKIGSSAPDYILRSIYENAFLSGEIKNKNADVLLHNWHKDEEQ